MRRTRDYATAIHEAGHAVIGRVLGMICGHATIEPDEDSGGHAIMADPWEILGVWDGNAPGEGFRRHGQIESVYRARILTFMAGWAAEVELLGGCWGGDGDDRYQIALMFEEIPIPGYQHDDDGTAKRYEARLRERARGLVRRHREAIQRVATALIARRTITAREIDALMKD